VVLKRRHNYKRFSREEVYELRLRITSLRDQDVKWAEISKITGVPLTTVYRLGMGLRSKGLSESDKVIARSVLSMRLRGVRWQHILPHFGKSMTTLRTLINRYKAERSEKCQ